jgi:restriction endonuclease S subunit
MNDGLVDRDDLDRKQDSALTPEEHLLVKPGDIAYNMMRMWQGAFGLADREGLVSPAYVVLKPKDSIHPAYAGQMLRTPRMLYLMWAYSYGLTDDRLRLYFPDFASIKVTVPTKQSQLRIAQYLETWDRAIDIQQRLVLNKERQRQALLLLLMTGDGGAPQVSRGLRIALLGDLIGALEAGVSVNGLDRAAEQGEVGVLKISAVTSGIFDPSANKAIRPDEIARARVSPRADRILVSRCNTAELLGASAYVDADYLGLFLPDKLWQLKPKSPNVVHMRWLAYWLAAETTRLKISSLATGSREALIYEQLQRRRTNGRPY